MRHACAMAGIAAACVMAAGIAASYAADVPVPFPAGYRDWTHVKSGVISDPAHPAFARYGGIHHIYANAKGMAGYRSGEFADGAVLVYDLHALALLPDGTRDQGARRHIDVMLKDEARFPGTAGWGYEEFMADAPRVPTLTQKARAACAACHAARAAHGHVFSEYRD